MKLLCFFQNKKNWLNKLAINFVIFAVVCIMCISVFVNLNATKAVSTDTYSAIYNGNKEKTNVSLMINVYWGTEFLDDMLKSLKEYEVHATFFIGGMWAAKNNETLKRIMVEGHEIASHAFFHKDHAKLTYQQNYDEINNTHKLVKEILNIDMNLFAPPSGSFNKNTLKAAQDLKYKTIMWTEGKDTIDWRDKDEKLIFTRATKNVKNGDLILMHPTEKTRDALPKILAEYKRIGMHQVTVSENLAD